MKTKIFLGLSMMLLLTAKACADVQSLKYKDVPVLSRGTYYVVIDPKPRTCYGAFFKYSCFAGHKKDGTEILFYEGIRGYNFKAGRSHRIFIEEIQYDLTPANMIMDDATGVEYRKIR